MSRKDSNIYLSLMSSIKEIFLTYRSMNSASTSVGLKVGFLHQLSRKLELTFIVFLGNKNHA